MNAIFYLFIGLISLSETCIGQNLILDYRFDNNWEDNVSSNNDLVSYSTGQNADLKRGVTSVANDSAASFYSGKGVVTTIPYYNNTWTGTAISFWTKSSINGMMIQGAYLGFGISADGQGRLSVFFDGGIAGALVSSSTVNLKDGSWHHVVAQNDGATTSLYIDGQLDVSQAEPLYVMTATNPGAKVYLGVHANNSMRLNGNLDEVKIYDNVLTLTEITNLYNAVTEDLNLMYSYSFDGDWMDRSPSYNHLTLYSTGTSHEFQRGYTAMTGDSCVEFRGGQGLITTEPVSNVGWTETAIAFWVKNCIDGFLIQGGYWGPGASVNSAGKLSVFFDGSAANGLQNSATTDLSDGLWHHVVAQNNGTITYLYIDGVLDASQPEVLLTLGAANPSATTIFGLLDNGNFRLDGMIDQVNIYNKMLDQNQITDLSSNSFNAVQKLNENKIEAVLVYPNPTQSELNIRNIKETWEYINIHNVNGQLLLSSTLVGNKIGVEVLNAGVYFLSILDTEGTTVARQKFIKQ